MALDARSCARAVLDRPRFGNTIRESLIADVAKELAQVPFNKLSVSSVSVSVLAGVYRQHLVVFSFLFR